jgi:ribosomal protein L1
MAEAKSVKKKEVKTKKAEKAADLVAETAVVGEVEPVIEVKETAKAGKRSAKAQKAVEVKQAKEVRKADAGTEDKPAKPAEKTVRTKAERAGKKYREAIKLIDKTKSYPVAEALLLAVKTNTAKFDASVELHVKLGVDPKQADQNIRDNVVLPGGTGKPIRIAVICDADDAAKAKSAGADIVDTDKIFVDLEKEDINFDVLISTPAMMARLGKYARLLGPRGLMPNPKSGTVTTDVAAAVSEAKAGKVEYRVDQAGIVHLAIGKVGFEPSKLQQNADAVLASIKAAKPASIKGIYIQNVYLSTTMGPSVKVDTATI